jgi:glycosyltransferase involved in cell wall biosynthesis
MESKTSKYTFSVITPAYNTAKYVGSCIESVINTGYDLTKVEHIIIDDGSTDNTIDVVKKYAKKYPHIKLYRKENSNWGGVMNYIKKNKLLHNDYATICDSDDQLTPNAFDAINKYSQDEDLIFGCFYR